MKVPRRKTRVIRIGNIRIGGNHPVAIQSMTKTKTSDTARTIKQIEGLKEAGCEIVRLAIKDSDDAKALKTIKKNTSIPLVADIHFNWRLALQAIDSGIDKIRLNPGNIYKKEQIQQIARAARLSRIPIRVGLNSGSVKGAGQGKNIARAMVKSALDYIRILEKCGFYDIVVSLKASNIPDTIEAYRKMAKLCDYPFHLGVTATGSPYLGLIKTSIALSALLLEGIGDTIRVSLTDIPEAEVRAAKSILGAMDLRHFGPQIISCPTCGRCEVDLIKVVKELENRLSTSDYRLSTRPIKLAVMGCVVNGPGEAKEADLGVAFGKKEGLLFKRGKPVRKISYDRCADVLLKELLKCLNV
ncbi:MAG: flavodoxin-dependent (E)-4-hydroxy-3-methylbut-2-enyl-diphosphate synthase [Candidatus Omnitrophica bacterium]|nr:flavodoxin-dependent (E)-4-hydroxy-3-methylbut-2-enyl-diphosphate synthase [Candidatus Omnitrophota bacterium]MDD5592392.1 flavodoxin-dependent (E)-4-hydroxy-3-methylbut-2-enyl-diphosphate synthase [Candidatus Omnitrophota bacterium]